MAKCIFCSRPVDKRRQVWPEWIIKRNQRKRYRTIRSDSTSTGLTVKAICRLCSSGWISRLEDGVKPLLAPILDDIPVLLGIDEQQILAGWIMKMAFVQDSVKSGSIFYRKEDCAAFKEVLYVPEFTRIWIGRHGGVQQEMMEAEFTRPHETGQLKGLATTLTTEHFVAQVVSLRLPQVVKMPNKITVSPRRGDWDKFLTPIWPHTHDVVTWPPEAFFSNSGVNSYTCLLDRWQVSTQPHHSCTNKVFSIEEARSAFIFPRAL
jgi:hypothetical protein